jgi:hypothetical protein
MHFLLLKSVVKGTALSAVFSVTIERERHQQQVKILQYKENALLNCLTYDYGFTGRRWLCSAG